MNIKMQVGLCPTREAGLGEHIPALLQDGRNQTCVNKRPADLPGMQAGGKTRPKGKGGKGLANRDLPCGGFAGAGSYGSMGPLVTVVKIHQSSVSSNTSSGL